MRTLGATLGWLMLVAGIALLLFGGLGSNTTASGSNALGTAEREGGWSCTTDATGQFCEYAGTSPGALQAKLDASAGWTQVGVGLTIGGAVLVGAAILASAGVSRSEDQGRPQQQPAQQFQPTAPTGPFAPQPNYGQQRPQ